MNAFIALFEYLLTATNHIRCQLQSKVCLAYKNNGNELSYLELQAISCGAQKQRTLSISPPVTCNRLPWFPGGTLA